MIDDWSPHVYNDNIGNGIAMEDTDIYGRVVLRNRQVIHVLGIKWLLISIVTGVSGVLGRVL